MGVKFGLLTFRDRQMSKGNFGPGLEKVTGGWGIWRSFADDSVY
jgi:hypothetical protein